MPTKPGMRPQSKRIDDLLTNGEQPFGPLDDETYASLRYEIFANEGKLVVPVVLSARGRLIDGHHRLMIAAEYGRKMITGSEWVTDAKATDAETEALAAIGYQMRRRQTTSADNATVARMLMRRFGWAQSVVAEKLGVSGAAVSKWLSNNPDPDFAMDGRKGRDGKTYTFDDDAPPKAKSIRTPAKAGQQVINTSNKHRAEITSPDLADWLATNADPDDYVELAAIWRATGEAALRIAEAFEAEPTPEDPF